jgi:hypothetical protein
MTAAVGTMQDVKQPNALPLNAAVKLSSAKIMPILAYGLDLMWVIRVLCSSQLVEINDLQPTYYYKWVKHKHCHNIFLLLSVEPSSGCNTKKKSTGSSTPHTLATLSRCI